MTNKKIIAVLLSVAMLLLAMPISSFAAELLNPFMIIGESTNSVLAYAAVDNADIEDATRISVPDDYGQKFYAEASAYEIVLSGIDKNGVLKLTFSFDELQKLNHSVWGEFPKLSPVGYTFDEMTPMTDEEYPDDPGTVIPIDDDPVIPIDDDPVIPIDDDPVIPIDDDPVIPIDDDPVIPIDDDPVIPIDDDPVIPIDDDPVIPIDDDPVIPIDDDPVIPIDDDPVIPIDDDPVIPIDDDPVIPIDDDPVIPIDDDPVIPIDDDPVIPIDDDPTDPIETIQINCIDDAIVQQICETSKYEYEVQLVDGRANLILYLYTAQDAFYDFIDGKPVLLDEGKAPWTSSWVQTTGTPILFNIRLADDRPLLKVIPEIGQIDIERDLFEGDRLTYLVLPYGITETIADIMVASNTYSVQVNNSEVLFPDSNGHLDVTLKADTTSNGIDGGFANTISIFDGEKVLDTYTLIGVSQRYIGLPDKVLDFLCIGSQYTNVREEAEYGLRAVRSLVGSNFDAGGVLTGPVSLGNFGGYITYYYENAILDDPNNPFGIDFITFGNSVEGSDEFAEPGQVWVSEDGDTWFALAGGMHYEDYADWNYTISYSQTDDGHTKWADSNGKSAVQKYYEYPDKTLYTLHDFSIADETSITLTGIGFNNTEAVNQYGNIRPPFSGFGYTDMGQKGLDSTDSNKAGNPYLGTIWLSTGREASSVTDGMDLAWAVDADGQPVKLENGVHYIKIVTASNIDNGAIGEKSTEVNMVRVAQAAQSAVGISKSPASISFDGNEVDLTKGKVVSDNVFVFDEVAISGPFSVKVDAAESNIYINNNCSNAVSYEQMPAHKIVRVIVQDGEKEPLIYVFNLTEGEAEETATLTLDANGGMVNGEATYTMKYDASMFGMDLPTPINENNDVTFAGWFADQVKFDSIPSDLTDKTLVAHWETKQADNPSDDTIRVSFRLIGSTLATEDVDLSKGEEGYYGAEYQNWVKTKTYTMHSDDSVYDLFVKATGDAGIESKGASSGYVKSIKAPDALGGYWLSEFTNGKYSGWMYTMDGKHANAIKDQILVDGAEVVFHYVNDYRYEVEDWFDEPAYPSLATDDTFYSRWLEAEDVKPGGQSGGTTPAQPGEESPGEEPVDNPDTPMGGNVARRFIDVSESDWFNDAVEYAVEHDIMTGTGETTFSPQRTLSRGMLAAMLYSLEGAPEMDGKTKFTDVDSKDWFAKGVDWATEAGIAAGYGESFGPNDDITREQMVVMLYGYAKMKGYELVEGEDLSGYEDAGEISSWALPAMQWAKAAGLVSGRSATKMAPQGTTTRAEAATIMRNFLENVAK